MLFDPETTDPFSDTEPGPSTPSSLLNHSMANPRIDACHRVLREVFGHSSYKGKQKEIVEAAVSGHDVFVLAPTGMGKSLCFQVPAASAENGITIVVSPLLALMKNQVQSLRQKGVPVVSLTSETPQYERQEIMQDLRSEDPEYRLLYVTPEKMGTGDFLKQLRIVYNNQRLNRLVIDEAHCISEWGHDFRGDYRKLGLFRDRFPGVPIMALTATATTSQNDIVRSLHMDEDNLYRATHPFNRSNLFYEVRYASNPDQVSQMAEICDYICTLHRRRGKPSSGIVYCRTRAMCNDLAAYLRGKGLSVKPYHKGIPAPTLDKTLAEWTRPGGSEEGGIDAVVATIAFGLGIDKGDVRYIIHYDLPKSFEGYYQETGRAGRNGALAKCVLYYSREDVMQVRRWVSDSHSRRMESVQLNDPQPSQRCFSSLSELVSFAENTNICRHISICRYFGETINANDPEVVKSYCDMMCDVCKYPDRTRKRKQALSSEEYASSQTSSVFSYADNDDENDPAETRRAAGKTGWGNLSRSESLTNLNGKTASRTSSITNSKRPANDAHGKPGSDSKRAKVQEFAPPLVTKAFNSASKLTKPFKTPSLQPPLKKSSTVNRPQHIGKSATVLDHPPVEAFATEVEETGGPSPVEDNTASADGDHVTQLPPTQVELEDKGSMKVPVDSRRKGMDGIRRALHKCFSGHPSLWGWLHSSIPRDDRKAANFFDNVARDLEYLALSFCSTIEGYEERVNNKCRAVNHLAEMVDAGKDPTEDDDVSEIVQSVKGVLQGRVSGLLLSP